MNPKVSILMPVYNNGDYVAEAIESMLCQTFSDFELIVLDDCSTDHSREVIESFADKRIIYHRNEHNLGLANNLNIGLDLARGEFIARMDGDDISLPERLQIQVDFLDNNPDIDLCSCGLEMFGEQEGVMVRERDFESIKVSMLYYSPVLHAPSVFRKEAFIKNNLYYNQDMCPAEDYDLWSRAVFHCKLTNIPDVLYQYRIHSTQETKRDGWNKNRKIQINYLTKAIKSLSADEVELFFDKFINYQNEIDVETLELQKKVYNRVISKNKLDGFLNQNLLKKRLDKTFISNVRSYLNNKSSNKPLWFYFQNRSMFNGIAVKELLKFIFLYKH